MQYVVLAVYLLTGFTTYAAPPTELMLGIPSMAGSNSMFGSTIIQETPDCLLVGYWLRVNTQLISESHEYVFAVLQSDLRLPVAVPRYYSGFQQHDMRHGRGTSWPLEYDI